MISNTALKQQQQQQEKGALSISSVLGNTVRWDGMMAVHPKLPLIAYTAGATIVVINCASGKQRYFFVASSSHALKLPDISPSLYFQLGKNVNKPFGAVCWSPDGEYLVAGETGKKARILVWSYRRKGIVAVLKGHKYGIQKIEFLNANQIISLGDKQDATFNLWQWKSGSRLVLLSNHEAESFAISKQTLVLCGPSLSKYWAIDKNLNLVSTNAQTCHVLPNFNEHLRGITSNRSIETLFASSKTSQLIYVFDAFVNDRTMKIPFEHEESVTMDCNDRWLLIGSSSGIIRIFDNKNLKFLAQLMPYNALIGDDKNTIISCISASFVNGKRDLISVVYSDKAMVVWDLTKLSEIKVLFHFPAHCGKVFGIEALGNDFASFGEDGSVRLWCVKSIDDSPIKDLEQISKIKVDDGGVRTIHVTPDGRLLFTFDRQGNLRITEISSAKVLLFKEIHDGEVLSFDIFPFEDGEKKYLCASAGRDCMLHVFEITVNQQSKCSFAHVQTLNDHSSAITGVKFAFKNGDISPEDGKLCSLILITSSLDKSVLFRTIDSKSETLRFLTPVSSHLSSSVLDLDIDAPHRYAVAVTKDAKLIAYHVQSANRERIYQLSGTSIRFLGKSEANSECQTINTFPKVSFDPSGIYAAVTISPNGSEAYSSDRLLNIVNFFSVSGGGHGSLITSVKWLSTFKHLVTCCADGIVIYWQLNDEEAVVEMRDRYELLQRKGVISELPRLNYKSNNANEIEDVVKFKPSSKWAKRIQPGKIPVQTSQEWIESGGSLLSPPSLKYGKEFENRPKIYFFSSATETEIEGPEEEEDFQEVEEVQVEPIVVEPPTPVEDQKFDIIKHKSVKYDTSEPKIEMLPMEEVTMSTPESAEEDLYSPSEVTNASNHRLSLSGAAHSNKPTDTAVKSTSYLQQLRKQQEEMLKKKQEEKEAIVKRLHNMGIDVLTKESLVKTSSSPPPNLKARSLRREKSREKLNASTVDDKLMDLFKKTDDAVGYMIETIVNPVESKEYHHTLEFIKDLHQRLTIALGAVKK